MTYIAWELNYKTFLFKVNVYPFSHLKEFKFKEQLLNKNVYLAIFCRDNPIRDRLETVIVVQMSCSGATVS